MVACGSCSKENSLDSQFCRYCGAAIAGDERTEAQRKLAELISEGYKIFNEGRTEEARLIAETALADDPTSTSALSLKGMCHERAGEIALALEAYEKVVERNPDSALDKIKVTHLRQSLTGKALVDAPPPRRGLALMGAAAAMVAVIAIGAAIASSGPTGTPSAEVTNPAAMTPGPSTAAFTAPTNEGKANTAETNTANTQVQTQSTPANETAAPPARDSRPTRPPVSLPNYTGNPALPNVMSGGIGTGNVPVKFQPGPNITVRPVPGGTKTDSGPDPKITNGSSEDPKVENRNAEPDPGTIDIKVVKPKPNIGGSVDLPDGNGVQALLKTARQQFLLGNYSQAANSYEAALRGGADAGSTHQRLGQCYANMGNNSAAANAYKRAISAYEAAPSSSGTQAALEACRRALKTVGG